MAIEKLNIAARDAQANVNSMILTGGLRRSYLVFRADPTSVFNRHEQLQPRIFNRAGAQARHPGLSTGSRDRSR